jgi:CRISPR/Cas system-associated exonuclease Cas4 (RecB family)
MHIPISNLELYLKCPRAYKLHMVDGVEPQHTPLALCKSITAKAVISQLHNFGKPLAEVTDNEIAQLCTEIWNCEVSSLPIDKDEFSEVVIQAKPETKTKPATPAVTKAEKFLEEIKTWVTSYAKLEKEAKVIHSNVYFEDTIGDITFTGYIDQLRKSPEGSLELIMFKTGSQSPHPAYLARDFAISLVCHAVWQGKLFTEYPESSQYIEFKTVPVAHCYYLPYLEQYKRKNGNAQKGDLKGNPFIPVSRSATTLLDFEYEILHAASGIEAQYFPMNVANILGCSACQYAYQCQTSAEPQMLEKVSEVYETVVN